MSKRTSTASANGAPAISEASDIKGKSTCAYPNVPKYIPKKRKVDDYVEWGERKEEEVKQEEEEGGVIKQEEQKQEENNREEQKQEDDEQEDKEPLNENFSSLTGQPIFIAYDKQKDLLSNETGHFSLVRAMHLADLITELNGKREVLPPPTETVN